MLAAQIAPSLVFALIGGVAADRFPPQRVILAANLIMAVGEGTFGLLVLTGRPPLWAMICLEALTGIGMALFYPASQGLLPRLVPGGLLQEASAISRMAMNTGPDGRCGGRRPAGRGGGAGLGARRCAASAWCRRCRCCCPSGARRGAVRRTATTARRGGTGAEHAHRAA